jgi:hypothetical protein
MLRCRWAIALHTCSHRASSFGDIGLFTSASRFRGGRTDQSVSNVFSSAAPDILTHKLLGRHCAGRSTNPGVKALRST